MKFGQLIEYNKINIFVRQPFKKWGRDTSSRALLFFKKFYKIPKQVVCSLVSIYFDIPPFGMQQK